MPSNIVHDSFGDDIGTLAEQLGASPSTATAPASGSGSSFDWGSLFTGIASGVTQGLQLTAQPVAVIPQPSYTSGTISTGTMLLLGGLGVGALILLGRQKGRR